MTLNPFKAISKDIERIVLAKTEVVLDVVTTSLNKNINEQREHVNKIIMLNKNALIAHVNKELEEIRNIDEKERTKSIDFTINILKEYIDVKFKEKETNGTKRPDSEPKKS